MKGSYYKILNQVYKALEHRIQIVGETGYKEKLLIYDLTSLYPIGKKPIHERIEDMIELGFIKREGEYLIWLNHSRSK